MTLNRRSFLFLTLLPPLCGGADLLLPGFPPAGAAWARGGRGGGDDDDDSGDNDGGDDDGGDDDGGDDDGGDDDSGNDDDGGDDDDSSGSGDDSDGDDDGSGSGGDDDDDDDSGGGSGGGSGSTSGNGGGSSGRGSKTGSGTNRGDDALPALKSGLRRVYGDGREERISGGIYERRNAAGRVTERRAATSADRKRLSSLQGKGLEAVVDVGPGRVTVTDRAGWREEFKGSTYRLIDPRGNLVTRRGITRKDIAQLRKLLNLR